ncbi:LytTR family two component transcriptional regulator [Nonlabens dokdonensis]|uniref:Response regulator, LytR/AlgR family n=2 Tax=Nonlabens dokdonensis TaxID=328515 RepID=L7W7E8_NONDD|nr:LytTR family DNA-binding domain-containing protein [Nonlabens dokdonensis]AGC77615.1 response regulator, LytR/AlgR family [Nonlabens dokdonensis DSW-6]PZX39837.1 LytTR family two component transcriptional regulator [Nonlabens dokdonensis]
MSIKTVIIDDEPKAIAILVNKIKRFCPELEIVASVSKPQEAFDTINELQPDLIFIDIAMPGMTGFDVLQQFTHPNFEIIFATAFDQYALDAIKHCAIGYLVKPIDNEDLVEAVINARRNIEDKNALQKNKLLIENLGIQKFQKKKIVIPSTDGLEFVKVKTISHFEGVDGYTKIHFSNRKSMLSSHSIGHFKKLLDEREFYHVHKSYIINMSYVERYLNDGYVVLQGDISIPVSRAKRTEFLNQLKQ